MKRILFLILSVPILLMSCRDEDDNEKDYLEEPEYEILSYSDKGSVYCTYSYPSVDHQGNPVTLSSAIMAWNPSDRNGAEIKTLIISCHITIAADAECPTRLDDSPSVNDVPMMKVLSTSAIIPELKQSVVIMPDYQGYGISRDMVHPYMSQELTARQVADAVKYGLQAYKSLEKALPFAKNWKSVCMGFSQGGAVALATQRYLEQSSMDKQLHLAGSFCGDGPYDLVETIRYYFEDNGNSYDVETQHRNAMSTMPVVLPLIVKGMLDTDPDMKEHGISDFFSKQFIDTGIFEWIGHKEMTTNDIAKAFYDMCSDGLTAADGTQYTAQQMQALFPSRSTSSGLYGVTSRLSAMLTPDAYRQFTEYLASSSTPAVTGRPVDDLMHALAVNSVVQGWEPTHRIVFLHSKYDTVVPYGNYLSFAGSHPQAQIKFKDLGNKDHADTGTSFFLSLISVTFSKEFTWLFAEK